MNFWKIGCVGLFVLGGACSGQGSDGSEQEVAVSSEALANASVWKSSWNGGYASAYSNTDTSYLSLNAWEDKSKSTRSTYLQFSGYQYDPSSYLCQTEEYCKGDPGAGGSGGDDTCEEYTWCSYTRYSWVYGWGQIPAGSFNVKSTAKGARLNVDLAQVPNFFQSTCTYDAVSGEYSCSDTTGGIFDVAWKEDGVYSSSNNGVSTQKWGQYSSRSTGQYDERSASVVGTALGNAVQANGNLSSSRGNSVTKEVFKN